MDAMTRHLRLAPERTAVFLVDFLALVRFAPRAPRRLQMLERRSAHPSQENPLCVDLVNQ